MKVEQNLTALQIVRLCDPSEDLIETPEQMATGEYSYIDLERGIKPLMSIDARGICMRVEFVVYNLENHEYSALKHVFVES